MVPPNRAKSRNADMTESIWSSRLEFVPEKHLASSIYIEANKMRENSKLHIKKVKVERDK